MTHSPRIVSICPSNTEILHALGLLPYTIALDNYSDWPVDGVRDKIRLGPDLHIDMEKLAALQPDLVVASLSVPGMEKVVDQLRQRGLPHLVLSPAGFDDMLADMRRVAAHCNTAFQLAIDSDHTIHQLAERIARIATATRNVTTRPRLYWEWWPQPVFSPAKENWLSELSQLAGAENIFANRPGTQVKSDGRDVIEAQPDYFLAVWTGVDQDKVPLRKIQQREGWQQLPCFRDGRFFILSEGLYCRPSPRLVDGLEQIVALLHPDVAQTLDLRRAGAYAPIRTWNGSWL